MDNTIITPNPPSQQFRQWLHGDTLDAALKRASEDVRDHPTNTASRWLLFELLCIEGNWDRSLKQLQTWATLSPDSDGVAQTMRGLIQSEHQRDKVFAGTQQPVPVIDLTPWMHNLVKAMAHNVHGHIEQADEARAKALDMAPDVSGGGNLGAFAWIADSDTRLGPVCEVVAQGNYRWLGFNDMRSITIAPPERLLDLVWASAQIVLFDGTPLRAFVPARYPLTLPPGVTAISDGHRLGRETTWTDVGETGVFATGQKTWSSDQGDWSFLELRECSFTLAGDASKAAV